MDFRIGQYVWTKFRNVTGILAVIVSEKETDVPVTIKRSKRANTVLLRFLGEESDKYHHVSKSNIYPFAGSFELYADQYVKKYEDGCEHIARAAKSENCSSLLQTLSLLQDVPPKKRPRFGTVKCHICDGTVGKIILCSICETNAVHKKCGGLDSNTWVCPLCTPGTSLALKKSESCKVGSPLHDLGLKRSTSNPLSYFSLPEIDVNQSVNDILEVCENDPILSEHIAARQEEYWHLLDEVKQQSECISAGSSEEYKKYVLQIQAFEKRETQRIQNDLIDLLQCTHIRGFENFSKLQKQYGAEGQMPSLKDTEKLKQTQREITMKLLKLKNMQIDKASPEASSNISSKVSPVAALSIKDLLDETINNVKNLKIEPKPPKLTPMNLYNIAKIIVDGTLANCEYTHGKHIDHVGGGTNPAMIHLLLDKIKQRYALYS